jgi:hypothetical protein
MIEVLKQALEAWESGDGMRLGEILIAAIEQAEKQSLEALQRQPLYKCVRCGLFMGIEK